MDGDGRRRRTTTTVDSSFEGNVGVVFPKSAQVTGLRRGDRGRAGLPPPFFFLKGNITAVSQLYSWTYE